MAEERGADPASEVLHQEVPRPLLLHQGDDHCHQGDHCHHDRDKHLEQGAMERAAARGAGGVAPGMELGVGWGGWWLMRAMMIILWL